MEGEREKERDRERGRSMGSRETGREGDRCSTSGRGRKRDTEREGEINWLNCFLLAIN